MADWILVSANEGGNSLTALLQIIVGPPTLTIKSTSSNTCFFSWSSFSTHFALQTNSSLTATDWARAGYPFPSPTARTKAPPSLRRWAACSSG
jgi:hypothetical protein